MVDDRRSPGFFTGALTGVVLTIPFIVVLWLASGLAGLPFVPFDVFDWVARTLPGPLITFGIDTMVAGLRTVGAADISQAAKTAEQIVAITGMVATGAAATGVLFVALQRAGVRNADSPFRAGSRWAFLRSRSSIGGLFTGLVIAVPVLLISLSVNVTASTGPVADAAWILVSFLGWGVLVGWAHSRLGTAAPTATEAGEASAVPLDRRRFLVRLGGASAAFTVVGAAVASRLGSVVRAASGGTSWSDLNPLPNADATVLPVAGTRAELTPVPDHYRIDINTRPPVVEEAGWSLRIGGLVEQPTEFTLAGLRAEFEPIHQFITLACISNPIAGSLTSTQRWTGVPLRSILERVRPSGTASHLRITSVDGFHEVVGIDDVLADERIMLTYAWDGLPLPVRNGFPLRIYIPDRYGMKQPKWIESIEAIEGPEDGYWVTRGWDREARMNATSVIDTVGVDMMIAAADTDTIIPIGGIAHAGARGVSRVEVRIDDGEWQPARLREPLSGTTWVIWRFDWTFREGDHTFTVRCFEGDGTPQIERRSPVRPSGATGLHAEQTMM